ncbi:LPS assembly lipoprotein LptE [Massilia sp. IC2-278]|uniref:LPS-assembly lipoprotein LptE n=1 Tax=Massilia sp. IC2-278 TaxID=2887200 RepID=UPI001E351350|nr:LPS assembly lipoprotein LptE [Massilia sp. IC2-278]MCC2962757.1 LPS assembly lipoprotein LptE [Massilia sp. IC2-278]
MRASFPSLMRAVCALLLVSSLAACGFKLRGSNGSYNMPFQTIHLGFGEASSLGNELKRNLRAIDNVTIVTKAEGAQARFEVVSEARNKAVLSLNNLGRVREYLLSYTVVFQVRDASGNLLLGPTEITLHRNLTFSEEVVLAKEGEEALLYRDMQSDLVQQIIRRLAAIKA